MGSSCFSSKSNHSKLNINGVKQELFVSCNKNQQSFKKEVEKQLNLKVEKLLQLIELIDVNSEYSAELIRQLNELIILRSQILLSRRWSEQKINVLVACCVKIIKLLEGNNEFEHYFPILSLALNDQCQQLDVYLERNSKDSTKYYSQSKLEKY